MVTIFVTGGGQTGPVGLKPVGYSTIVNIKSSESSACSAQSSDRPGGFSAQHLSPSTQSWSPAPPIETEKRISENINLSWVDNQRNQR